MPQLPPAPNLLLDPETITPFDRGGGVMRIYWVYGGRFVNRTMTETGETFEHLPEYDRSEAR